MTDIVLTERRGAVLVLTLNRPDRLNAWNDELEVRYLDLLAEAEDDPEIRAVVVTGAGRGFCAGADMDRLSEMESSGYAPPKSARPRTYPYTLRKPLIAALNGAAAGIGLVEALYCDLRFAVPTAKLTTAFARRGLIGEYGITWLLPRLVGSSRALDLLLSARIVLAEEAATFGLVDRLCSPETLLDEAVAYAQDLAGHCSPAAMADIKAQVRADLARGFDEAVGEAHMLLENAFTRPDVPEGVRSYLERRPPAFPSLPPRG